MIKKKWWHIKEIKKIKEIYNKLKENIKDN